VPAGAFKIDASDCPGVARTWLSIPVELIDGRGRRLWPRPGLVFAAARDAAAHGNPVVTTGFGGHLDYLADSPYRVDFDLVPVIHPHGLPSDAPHQRWAEPILEHGAAVLREVAARPERAMSSAASIAADIRWRYRPEAIASAFRSAVEHHSLAGMASTAAAGAHAR
jgi:hypothetical protein